MPPIYYPIQYLTYNRQSYYACIGSSILFLAFYIILVNILRYELNNKRGICEPDFYYSSACNDQMANTILADTNFYPSQNTFYNAVHRQFNVSQNAQEQEIDGAGDAVQGTLDANANFTQNSIEEIQEVTDVIQLMTTKYLGNLQQFLNNAKSTSSSTWNQVQEIPGLLQNLQNQINQAIVTPALARYVDPLQKLYQSLTDLSVQSE